MSEHNEIGVGEGGGEMGGLIFQNLFYENYLFHHNLASYLIMQSSLSTSFCFQLPKSILGHSSLFFCPSLPLFLSLSFAKREDCESRLGNSHISVDPAVNVYLFRIREGQGCEGRRKDVSKILTIKGL